MKDKGQTITGLPFFLGMRIVPVNLLETKGCRTSKLAAIFSGGILVARIRVPEPIFR